MPVKRIAKHLDRQNVSLRKFIADHGGRRPAPRQCSELRLSLEECEGISRGLAAGLSIRAIADGLDRSPSTVCREVNANGGRTKYRALQADRGAQKRAVPGHWEGDLIFGRKMTAIGALVERNSRYVILLKLPNEHGAESVRKAMTKGILTLPAQLRKSITWAQGKEMAQHVQFTVDTGVQIYFCDPKSPWKRGSNDNTNGLLRRY